MRFRFDDDQLAIRDAVRAFAADHLALADVAAREGLPASPRAWTGLADLGILGLLADDGMGLVEAALVFEELGAHLVPGPVLWTTLAAPFVPGAADGAVRVAGVEDASPAVVEHGAEADVLLVLRGEDVELVPCPDGEAGAPLDPLTPVVVHRSLPRGEVVAHAAPLRRQGLVLSAAMLVGAAQGALDVARDYALEREQFDRPIGSFQAVKHLLADMYVRVELARAATYAAAAIGAGRGDGDPDLTASTAKVLAGEAGIANGRAAVQVLGGMGFTWDMLPHLFLKRSWVLEHAFGTGADHASRLGEAVAAR